MNTVSRREPANGRLPHNVPPGPNGVAPSAGCVALLVVILTAGIAVSAHVRRSGSVSRSSVAGPDGQRRAPVSAEGRYATGPGATAPGSERFGVVPGSVDNTSGGRRVWYGS